MKVGSSPNPNPVIESGLGLRWGASNRLKCTVKISVLDWATAGLAAGDAAAADTTPSMAASRGDGHAGQSSLPFRIGSSC